MGPKAPVAQSRGVMMTRRKLASLLPLYVHCELREGLFDNAQQ